MNLLKWLFNKNEAADGRSPQQGVVSIGRIRDAAEDYYRRGDFFCSEAIVKTIRDEFNLDISDDAIAMSSGFPVGVGGSECLCGAVAGGCICIGMVFGRRRAGDRSVAKTMELSKELHDRFKERNKVLCCRILTKGMKKGSKEHMEQCIRFTGEVAVDTARIMAREMHWPIEE